MMKLQSTQFDHHIDWNLSLKTWYLFHSYTALEYFYKNNSWVKGSPPFSININNAKRRKAEDKMAMIFIAIVTGWLVTNFPRICLNFQEVLNVEK